MFCLHVYVYINDYLSGVSKVYIYNIICFICLHVYVYIFMFTLIN